MIKALDYQGTGRQNLDEVIHQGCKSIDALTEILGDKAFFLGDKPTSVDATAFAFIANLLMSPVNDSLKQHTLKIDTIRAYCDRMWDMYYPDYPKPTN